MKSFGGKVSKIVIILLCVILFYEQGVQAINSDFIMKQGYLYRKLPLTNVSKPPQSGLVHWLKIPMTAIGLKRI